MDKRELDESEEVTVNFDRMFCGGSVCDEQSFVRW